MSYYCEDVHSHTKVVYVSTYGLDPILFSSLVCGSVLPMNMDRTHPLLALLSIESHHLWGLTCASWPGGVALLFPTSVFSLLSRFLPATRSYHCSRSDEMTTFNTI